MKKPNEPCKPIDLGEHLNYNMAPFWVQAAFGHDKFANSRLLCPVCGSCRIRPLENEPASIFTANRHFEADLWGNRVEEAFDSGKMDGVLCFMLDIVCENDHRCQLDLHFSMNFPEAGMTLSVILPDDEFRTRHAEEFAKWGPRCGVETEVMP